METLKIFGYFLLVALVIIMSLSCSLVDGEIRLRDILQEKDKKSLVTKKLKKASTESLQQFIKEVDSSGMLRKIIKRKIHIPKDSSLTLSTQVSRPNIFPNIFNQGDGFIMDAVVEWPIWLDLHTFAEAINGEPLDPSTYGDGTFKTELDDEDEGFGDASSSDSSTKEENSDEDDDEVHEDDDFIPVGPPILGGDEDEFRGKALSMSGIVGLERCLIYEKLETGMSVYLDITQNQSHDCVLRAICESQLIADFYPDAPSSIFFEVIHMVLK